MAAEQVERRGFTLVEIMIVVAIVGILAAFAIPSFSRYQLRSKSAEAKVNLKAIATAQETYSAEFGVYVGVLTPVPAAAPGRFRSTWVAGSNFDMLGWAPEGSIYFQYQVNADVPGAGSLRYSAELRGDIDGDGVFSFWGYVKPPAGSAAGLPGSFPGTTCLGTGVFASNATGRSLESAGPCDVSSGRVVF